MFPLNQTDHRSLEEHDLSIPQIEDQLHQLREGVPPLRLVRPCSIGDGIIQFSPQQHAEYHQEFEKAWAAGRISKFIPASGAATRMFKDLLQFLEKNPSDQPAEQKNSTPLDSLIQAWAQLNHFPFIDDLRQYFKTESITFQDLYQRKQMAQVFQALLNIPGLGYAQLPKALLPFHHYPNGTRTSLEEHVHEAMMYGQMGKAPIQIHLTVSSQFKAQVMAHVESIQQKLAQSGMKFEVTVSIQKPSTNTLALDSQGGPFRDKEDQLVFRPGGHGALLENLNDYQGDIICISNIDNVVPDHLKAPVIEWRKSLAGYLIALQDKIFQQLKLLESTQPPMIEKTKEFIQDHLQDQFPRSFAQLNISGQVAELKRFLHRPLRVCGVVSNTGQAGGGPFWIQQSNGFQSRQIVEQSQADPQSDLQQQLFRSSTHFNPVDLVCGVRNHQGTPFNLLEFRDPATSFISDKTYQGRPLKALEWPGLWNGGMADWITLFIEIPNSTFNPVKTFMDWLHPNHQPSP